MKFIKKISILIQVGLILLITTTAAAAATVSPGSMYTGYVDYVDHLWFWGTSPHTSSTDFLDGFQLSKIPTRAESMGRVKSVEVYEDRTAVIKEDGTLVVWGNNSFAGLGNGSCPDDVLGDNYISTPYQVLTDVKKVSLGTHHTLALKNDGTVWAWGDSKNGQIGNGDMRNETTAPDNNFDPNYVVKSPVKIMDNVKDIAAGADISMAVTNDSKAYVWGKLDALPELAKENGSRVANPIFFEDNVNKVFLSQNEEIPFGAAILNNGALQTFGDNSCGLIGNGSNSGVVNPTIIFESNTKDVKIGNTHIVAIKDDGTVYTWGDGNDAQLGDGVTGPEPHIVNKPWQAATGARDIGAGADTTAYTNYNGQVFLCGANQKGQCGAEYMNVILKFTRPTYTPWPVIVNPSPNDPDSSEEPSESSIAIYRLNNKVSNEHLFTSDRNEYETLAKGDWEQEGVAWNSPESGDPVYRLYSPVTKVHLFTTDENEVNVLKSRGWSVDCDGNPIFYSGGDKPIYRLYNEAAQRHLLTTDLNEYNTLGVDGWKQEDVAFNAIS